MRQYEPRCVLHFAVMLRYKNETSIQAQALTPTHTHPHTHTHTHTHTVTDTKDTLVAQTFFGALYRINYTLTQTQ